MIQSPKNLTEQLLNLCERLAVEMRALFNTVDTKLGKTEKATSAKMLVEILLPPLMQLSLRLILVLQVRLIRRM